MLLCQEKPPPKRNTGVWLRLLCPALLSTLICYCQERWLQIPLLHLADCFFVFFSLLSSTFQIINAVKALAVCYLCYSVCRVDGRKCFSSERVGKTDTTAPLLNLMAESSEPAGGEGLGLSAEEAVARSDGKQTGVSASFRLKCRRRWIMNPHGNAAAAEQTAAFRKLSSQHKQIIPVSFFIISPGAAHQIPPAGLRHRDPGEWFGLSTILFSRFHINKVFCSRRAWKNHNAAEFSLVLFNTTRIFTGSVLCFLWDL